MILRFSPPTAEALEGANNMSKCKLSRKNVIAKTDKNGLSVFDKSDCRCSVKMAMESVNLRTEECSLGQGECRGCTR